MTIALRYSDGMEGVVDLSHLAGKGVFRAWECNNLFEDVSIGSGGEIRSGDEIDLCDSVHVGGRGGAGTGFLVAICEEQTTDSLCRRTAQAWYDHETDTEAEHKVRATSSPRGERAQTPVLCSRGYHVAQMVYALLASVFAQSCSHKLHKN